MMALDRILILDGMQRSTLAAVRSLGRKGLRITVGEHVIPCLSSSSKYCADTFMYRSPLRYPREFLADLSEYLEKCRHDFVLPMTDVTSYLLASQRGAMSDLTHVIVAELEPYERASDKGRLVQLAEAIGVRVPRTYFLENIADFQTIERNLQYPVVLKPRKSKYLTPTGWVIGSVSYASTREGVIGILRSNDSRAPLPLIQEKIEGPGVGAFFLMSQGSEVASFFHKRLREKPPSGGVSVLRESIPIMGNIRDSALKLLGALSWNGVAMVEFKLDVRSNQPFLMEINPRFWGSLQLAVDSGVDFPYLLYRLEAGEEVLVVRDYSFGIKSRWLMGDLDHFLIRLFKSGKSLHLPKDAPGRLSVLLDFLRFHQPGLKYEIESRDDPGPCWFELRDYLGKLLRLKKYT